MDDGIVFAIIFIGLAATLGIGELLLTGTFFLLPFAVGAVLAAVASLISPWLGVVVFLLGSVAAFFALKPLARRLDSSTPNPAGVGANRLVGEAGVVLEQIPGGPSQTGLVRIGREDWRAESSSDAGIGVGQAINVLEVVGTRVIVEAR